MSQSRVGARGAIESLVEGLDDEQRAAVMSEAKPLCLLAGPGSGKTRVLTHRVARRILDRSADGEHTLVLTFTRKAAEELRTRRRNLGAGDGVTTGTFHAIAYAQLRRRWLDTGRPVPVIASQPMRMLDTALANIHMQRTANPRTLAAEISWAKSRRLTPDGYEEGLRQYRRRPPLSASQIARVYNAYESEKAKRRSLDFDDLLLLMTNGMAKDREFASSQRWKFRHIFVDEFQDMNKAQFDLMRAWLGDRDDLFVVGDANQAIYEWNGADSSYLLDFDRHVHGAVTMRLHTNYRSTAHVLAAANAVLPGVTPASGGERASVAGVAPVVRSFETEQAEAAGIARALRQAHSNNRRWADMVVLVRTNVQRLVIEAALDEARIPYRAAGGAAWLYRSEVRSALDHLRAAPRHRLAERAADIDQMALELSDETRPYVEELAVACRQCLVDDPDMSIADFLSWVEVASRHDGPSVGGGEIGAVTVTTFHRAKGLEWDVVFLAGLEDGLVPHGSMDSPQIDEERRLFYVAITRAREELHCSWSANRLVKSKVVPQKPSPWLFDVAESGAEVPTDITDSVAALEVIDEGRTVLHVDAPPVDETRAAIERWRVPRAKLNGVEPRLILSDDAIDAIIELRPSSKEELADVEGFGAVRAASVGDEILELLQSDGV